jgi:hypothetical protein
VPGVPQFPTRVPLAQVVPHVCHGPTRVAIRGEEEWSAYSGAVVGGARTFAYIRSLVGTHECGAHTSAVVGGAHTRTPIGSFIPPRRPTPTFAYIGSDVRWILPGRGEVRVVAHTPM